MAATAPPGSASPKRTQTSDVKTVAIASDERDGHARTAWAAQGGDQMAAAIRTGEPAVCKDFNAATAVGPWRDEAVRLGYRSCVALPLIADGRPFGALTLCSGEETGFDASEATLLKELADDLAFGIVALRTRANQRQAEAALRTANERYARQEAALTKLTKSYLSAPDDFTDIVRGMTEVVANTLSVALVGVWRHDENGTVTRCQDLFKWPDGVAQRRSLTESGQLVQRSSVHWPVLTCSRSPTRGRTRGRVSWQSLCSCPMASHQ